MNKIQPAFKRWLLTTVCLTFTLTDVACSETLTPSPAPSATAILVAPTTTPQPTPRSQELNICATEPQAVSPFWPTQAGDDILALFYEPALERVGYHWEPRLVERVPSPDTGDVITRAVSITQGMRYADSLGVVHTYDDTEPTELPQLTVIFTLKNDLTWSDGTEITAKDAVLGYHIAQSAEAQGKWRLLAERTARFFALDDYTLQWEGIPGYISADYAGFLFPLQPYHRWQGDALPKILLDRTPLATGPFQITAWETNREVRLQPNPYYSGETPQLTAITVRFPQQHPQHWISIIYSGECDVILPEPAHMIDWRDWAEMQNYGYINILSSNAPVILRLDFNLSPELASPINQKAVRQGLAACIDRENLVSSLPGEATMIAQGFLPPGHPANATGEAPSALLYNDSQEGQQLLADAGWIDEDGDGTREAHDITGFKDGYPLSLTLHMTPQYLTMAAHLASNMEACGADINVQPTDANLLYTSFEASPLYGRTFELALFGWQVDIPQICGAWRSDRIPTEQSNWTGENFSGYSSELYDTTCAAALTTIDVNQQIAELMQAQSLLNLDTPTLFLAWRPYWFVAQPFVQGLQPDTSAVGAIWNAEAIFIDE
ncbi:MAG: ABC transporter substrate-binding protein [Anaerolineae bacterium]|nr:ABC transporter substrate-binding protein [Anaerolineae bacterium]